MLASVEHLSSELSSMRTNRAHAGLVSGINIDYFGSTMKLSELGQISVSDGTMILIQLWDKSAVEMVSKEIESSDIGINPSIDGDTIRLVVPPLNEERRLELVKIVKKKSEDAKISIRNVRRSAMDEVKDLEKKVNYLRMIAEGCNPIFKRILMKVLRKFLKLLKIKKTS